MSKATTSQENKNVLVQYGCSTCRNIFASEQLCDEHILNCPQNKRTTEDSPKEASRDRASKRKLDHSIAEDYSSNILDSEHESTKGKKSSTMEIKIEQEYVPSGNTVYGATSQMLSENEMLITLPYDENNDSTRGPLDFSNEVAITYEQHINDFEPKLISHCNENQEECGVTIENYEVEDFNNVDRDTTIKILSVFTSKPSKNLNKVDSIDCQKNIEGNNIRDNKSNGSDKNKVLTLLNNVNVKQLPTHPVREVTVTNIPKHTEGETEYFEIYSEVPAEFEKDTILKEGGLENETPGDKANKHEGKNEGALALMNIQKPDVGKQDKTKMDKILQYKDICKKTPNKKKGIKKILHINILQKNSTNTPDPNKIKAITDKQTTYKIYHQNMQKRKNPQKYCPDPSDVQGDFQNSSDYTLYSYICAKEEKDVEEPDELSVYEFYDEEEERVKALMQKKLEVEKEIKRRTCKFCNEVFKDPMDVLRHKRKFHKFEKKILSKRELEPYLKMKNKTECPICFKSLGSKVPNCKYLLHMMTHCDQYDFQCRVCYMQFRRKDHWMNHESRHVVRPEPAKKD